MTTRPWIVQARFRLPTSPRTWGDWRRVESYGSEARARAKMEAFDAENRGEHETRIRVCSAEAFAREYASNAGMTVNSLTDRGLRIESCDCDDVHCLGWRMTAKGERAEWA